MPQKDTIAISDSLTCRFIVVDKPQEPPTKETLRPIDSLWGSQTLSTTIQHSSVITKQEKESNDYIVSGFTLLFFILLLLFFREVLSTVPNIIGSTFKLKAQRALEERLSSVNPRDITTLIGALFLTLFIVITFGNYFEKSTEIPSYTLIPASLGVMVSYWIFKSLALKFSGWLAKRKQPFLLIGKIGYNHLILASIVTIPVIIIPIFTPHFNEVLLLKVLSICYLLIFTLYFIRVYQILISYHFSHFFYILYLCTVEILPIALFINFLLSH